MSDSRVIANFNACCYMGVETHIQKSLLSHFACVVYSDKEGRKRLVYSPNGISVAGIIFDKQGLVLQMYTSPSHRRQGIMKQLLAVAFLLKIRYHFDKNLTSDGQSFVNHLDKGLRKAF